MKEDVIALRGETSDIPVAHPQGLRVVISQAVASAQPSPGKIQPL